MEIPGLGLVTRDERFGWFVSKSLHVPILGNKICQITVDRKYAADPAKDDYHQAIANFLSLQPSTLNTFEHEIFKYYQDTVQHWDEDSVASLSIQTASDVWKHIQLGGQPMVERRAYGDRGIYVSLECNCDWEPEHGLQIVFKNGRQVCKIGAFDGHLTNSDAYDNDELEDVIYVSF